MRKMAFGLSCLCIVLLCGCEKNSCQTFLQGSWIVKYPRDSASIAMDSLLFYNGDSLSEKFRLRYPADTDRRYDYSTYFITDKCDEIDFNGNNTWTQLSPTTKYNILLITPNNVQIRSKADSSGCDSCIVSFYR